NRRATVSATGCRDSIDTIPSPTAFSLRSVPVDRDDGVREVLRRLLLMGGLPASRPSRSSYCGSPRVRTTTTGCVFGREGGGFLVAHVDPVDAALGCPPERRLASTMGLRLSTTTP